MRIGIQNSISQALAELDGLVVCKGCGNMIFSDEKVNCPFCKDKRKRRLVR